MSYHDYFRSRDWMVYDRSDREDMEDLQEYILELMDEGKDYVEKIFTTGCGETFVALRVLGSK